MGEPAIEEMYSISYNQAKLLYFLPKLSSISCESVCFTSLQAVVFTLLIFPVEILLDFRCALLSRNSLAVK